MLTSRVLADAIALLPQPTGTNEKAVRCHFSIAYVEHKQRLFPNKKNISNEESNGI
jgi:hypothetical protein